mgnify:CR=1 FL=1|tara:strand:+ start:10987 stop:12864 length:1878 start_codon:yes stop_codon:yes gene_type:complete
MSTIKVPAIFTAIDKFSGPVKRMSRSTQTFAQKAEVSIARLDRRMRRLGPSIGAMGKQMLGLAATGAIVAGVGSAVRTIRDFEQANADLSAVMSSATGPQLEALSKDAERLGGITAKTATEVVGLQESFARLGFETPDILNMTESTIAGSIAMNAELAETAELTGAMIKTFKDLESTDTTQVIDQMTLATQKSALNFVKLQTSLPIVAGASQAAGISFERTMALLGKLSDSGIDASSSATALRNIFLESAKEGLNYEQILTKIEKNQNKLTAANDQFGKRAAVSATILSDNIRQTQELTDVLERAKKGQDLSGAASIAAAKRLDTLGGTITLLSSKWDSLLLASNKNTGGVGKMTSALKFLTENLETISMWVLRLAGFWVALKIALFAARMAMIAYNVILGISSALSATAAVSVGANTTALTAYNVMTKIVAITTKLWTGAQWLLNIALNANPIGLIILAIAALVAVTILIIKYYDQWGAAATLLLGPFGMLINLVMSFRKHWDFVSDAFTKGGFIEGIKSIGVVMIDSLLAPVQQLLEMIESIPGVDFGLSDKIEKFRAGLFINAETPALNTKESEQNALGQTIENNTNTNATLTVLAPKGSTKLEQDENFFPTITSSLLGGFN